MNEHLIIENHYDDQGIEKMGFDKLAERESMKS